ncbi:uncharacterized protein MELLADRAFT_105758 [Melampsora larici-populina 98AG31]|uniref:Uncharacterized protein n=1 Tax=Melampsora larici-populina (strain 98AG31 / pathotype 3-4-7) TaxID=747676 RepID=F4RJ83_MELLP|nr:uncharacterized protein MELLADRAFT_105758 [Melampsora larici-populina 98AG31]EGG07273.1 hypothetical protein MELLADRAFT_105758 [Melampsora larici-populina 98AG31]
MGKKGRVVNCPLGPKSTKRARQTPAASSSQQLAATLAEVETTSALQAAKVLNTALAVNQQVQIHPNTVEEGQEGGGPPLSVNFDRPEPSPDDSEHSSIPSSPIVNPPTPALTVGSAHKKLKDAQATFSEANKKLDELSRSNPQYTEAYFDAQWNRQRCLQLAAMEDTSLSKLEERVVELVDMEENLREAQAQLRRLKTRRRQQARNRGNHVDHELLLSLPNSILLMEEAIESVVTALGSEEFSNIRQASTEPLDKQEILEQMMILWGEEEEEFRLPLDEIEVEDEYKLDCRKAGDDGLGMLMMNNWHR